MGLVAKSEFGQVLERLKDKKVHAWDTETTGLYPFKNGRMFSLIISDDEKDFYFNFTAFLCIMLSLICIYWLLQEFILRLRYIALKLLRG
jgi:hypothetical protein